MFYRSTLTVRTLIATENASLVGGGHSGETDDPGTGDAGTFRQEGVDLARLFKICRAAAAGKAKTKRPQLKTMWRTQRTGP